jgi:hypothetical protein
VTQTQVVGKSLPRLDAVAKVTGKAIYAVDFALPGMLLSMPTVFFLARLRDGVTPEAYEQWVRSVDYPTARAIPSILSYKTHRIAGPYRQATTQYDYIEVVEVTNIDEYRRELAELPPAQELRRQIIEYLEPSDSYWGHLVEERRPCP